jgi:hypothetical protein
MGVELISRHDFILRGAWVSLIDIFIGLADKGILPRNLIDIDDITGIDGNLLPPSLFALRCRAHWTYFYGEINDEVDQIKNAASRSGLWGSISSLLWRSSGHCDSKQNRQARYRSMVNPRKSSLPHDCATNSVEAINAVLLATGALYVRSVKFSLVTVSSFLSALLVRTDPLTFNEVYIFVFGIFEVRVALALEHAWRVIILNQHRAILLWPLMHLQLTRILACGVTGFPYLAERSMVLILRAAALLQRRVKRRIACSLEFVCQLNNEIASIIPDRLALGLLNLLRMRYFCV